MTVALAEQSFDYPKTLAPLQYLHSSAVPSDSLQLAFEAMSLQTELELVGYFKLSHT